MIKNYTNFINENLLNYLNGPSKEDVWKQINKMNLNKLIDDKRSNYNFGEFIDNLDDNKKRFFLIKLKFLSIDKIIKISTKLGFLGGIKLAIKKGCNNSDLIVSFNIAAEQNYLHIIKYYVEELHIPANNNSSSALQLASQNGHLEIVKYLVEHGANISGRENLIINSTVIKGQYETAIYLLEHGAEKDNYTLSNACYGGNIEIVKYLFKKFEFNDKEKEDAVYDTIKRNNLTILKYLVKQNIKIDVKQLALAYSFYMTEIINYIIETFNYSDDDIKIAKSLIEYPSSNTDEWDEE